MEGIAEEQLPPMGPGLDQDDAQGVQVQVGHRGHVGRLRQLHCSVVRQFQTQIHSSQIITGMLPSLISDHLQIPKQ